MTTNTQSVQRGDMREEAYEEWRSTHLIFLHDLGVPEYMAKSFFESVYFFARLKFDKDSK